MKRVSAALAIVGDAELTIMTAPQNSVMAERNLRGPILRMTTVAGGWKMTYGMKKTRVIML